MITLETVMNFSHELIVPETGFPFKLFIFEGGRGNYYRDKHWHRSIEIFAVCSGGLEFYIDDNEHFALTEKGFMMLDWVILHLVAGI